MQMLSGLMKKILFSGFILGSLLVVSSEIARGSHLNECIGDGTIQFNASPRDLKPGGKISFQVSFKWNTQQQKCVSEPVEGRIYFKKTLSGEGTELIFSKDWGKLNPDQTYSASGELSYEKALDLVGDKSGGGFLGGEVYINGRIGTGDGDPGHSDTLIQTSTSLVFTVFGPDATYACVAANGRYACSTDGTLAGCNAADGCRTGQDPKSPCAPLGDKSLCGAPVPSTPTNPTPSTPGGPGTPGKTITYDFNLTNPLGAEDFLGLINIISIWIFNLTIPVAIIVIIWAGLRFMWARGDQGEVTKAKEMLKYAVIGLIIVFIGRGFVTLVQSIINLGGK